MEETAASQGSKRLVFQRGDAERAYAVEPDAVDALELLVILVECVELQYAIPLTTQQSKSTKCRRRYCPICRSRSHSRAESPNFRCVLTKATNGCETVHTDRKALHNSLPDDQRRDRQLCERQ